jgi:hypothetical protein
LNNNARFIPPIMRELVEARWNLSHALVHTRTGEVRYDLIATNPSTTLRLRSIREFAEPQRYLLTGQHVPSGRRRGWHLSAEAPNPAALAAAIHAARPSIHPRAPLSRMLRSSGWQADCWQASGHNVITYTSPAHSRRLRASFVIPTDGCAPHWKIRLPRGQLATASPDIPAPVLCSFLLASAAEA